MVRQPAGPSEPADPLLPNGARRISLAEAPTRPVGAADTSVWERKYLPRNVVILLTSVKWCHSCTLQSPARNGARAITKVTGKGTRMVRHLWRRGALMVGLLMMVAVLPVEVSISFQRSLSPTLTWLSLLLFASSLLLGCTGVLLERRATALAVGPIPGQP
jgi:hypothetical protein